MTKTLFVLLVTSIGLLTTTMSSAQTNLALTATVSSSFVSSWETLGAVNDGKEPTNSSTKPGGVAYGNWNGESSYNTYNWVQYEWDNAQKLTSTSIYWWDDGGGIKQPSDAYIEYWSGTAWVKAGSIGNELNKYNTLEISIQTKKIRINMVSETSTGIFEWQVFGIESGPCDPSVLTGMVQVNANGFKQTNMANVLVGDSIKFKLTPEDGTYTWSGPEGFTASTSELSLTNMQSKQSGTYIATYMNDCGAFTTFNFVVTVSQSVDGAPYSWASYTPTLNYNFKDEFPALEMPTKDLDDCTKTVGTQSSEWWTFKWGPTANSLVTEAAITPMLKRMNTDFAYFRDVMGWPPDKRAKRGYRSTIYLFGSGLCSDNAANTEKGGWQSSIDYQGESWPMVLLSYYPVYSFDPTCKYSDRESQMGAVVHEGIHAVLADLPGCKNSAWFQEGGNTWLQQEAAAQQSGDFSSMGFLNGCPFIAPFMPIECYSGWLQDDSFGGPSAEGVNMSDGSTQICTWRTYLGGNQYGNTFPTFLGQVLGKGSIPWIWRHCESRVLEGMADSLGELQMRRLIMEYRAKQAVLDMGEWTGAIKKLVDGNFKTQIKAEWTPAWKNPEVWIATPYARTTNDGNGLLTPEYRTTPGWSGANQIPLLVSGDTVVVNFQPIGANLSCQLCYRTKEGEIVYSQPVYGGDCVLRLDKKPANDVVFAVICNSDYIYYGEATRKAHFDYRLQLVSGISRTANTQLPWYDWTKTITNTTVSVENIKTSSSMINKMYPNPVENNSMLNIELNQSDSEPMTIEIRNIQGQLVYSDKASNDVSISTESTLSKGIYLVTAKTSAQTESHKLVVK